VKVLNYLNLNQHPIHLQFFRDRTQQFAEIYHAHQGMEMIMVHEGSGSIVVEQQIFELKAGMLFFFRPFQLHRVIIDEQSQHKYIRSFFVFEPALLDEILSVFPATQDFFRTLWKDSTTLQMINAVDIQHLLLTYEEMITRCKPEQLLETQWLFLTNLMHHLMLHHQHSNHSTLTIPSVKGRSSTIAEQIMEWIETHYMEPFQLDELAQFIHLSPNHISALFKQVVGSSITEYLTARRIRQACWLLRTSDLSIQTIGIQIGLNNFSYFCQLFKRHVGVTPFQFKQSTIHS